MIGQLTERARRWLSKRRAFRACFLDDNGIATASGARALKDLARFCDAYRSTVKVSSVTGQVDPIASAVAQGRREVWLHLQAQLELPDAAVLQMMEERE